jgi:hypothetical protein
MAFATYLLVAQYIPSRRICAMFKDMYDIHISEGSIDSFLEQKSKKRSGHLQISFFIISRNNLPKNPFRSISS